MKKHSVITLILGLLFLIGNLGAIPYDAEPQSEPPNVIYLPVISNSFQPEPSFSTSYYIQLDARQSQSQHYNQLQTLGCNIGLYQQSITGPQDHVVILALGKPWTSAGQYQVKIYRPIGVTAWVVVNLSSVDELIQQVIKGYWSCRDADSKLTLAVGINTFDTYGILGDHVTPDDYVDEAYGHGRYYARMIKDLTNWTVSQGYGGRITIAGALDSEVAFNPPKIAKAWMNGYTVENTSTRVYNYGACDGCPYDEVNRTTRWVGGNGWTQEDIWYMSWGAPPAWAIPEIYLYGVDGRDGKWKYINAIQWKLISWYGWKTHGQKIEFAGALTQNQACIQRGGCVGSKWRMDIPPLEGWSALYNELNEETATAQSFLRWASDMRWMIK